MYTVVRFHIAGASISVKELGSRLTALGLSFDGADRVPELRVSCTLARDDAWPDHVATIEARVRTLSALLHHVREQRGHVSIDIAIDPDDFEGLVGSYELPRSTLQTLLDERISVVISVYR